MSEESLGWYEHSVELAQSDLVFDFPILLIDGIAEDGRGIRTRRRQGTVALLTQTCDLAKKSQESLLVAEVLPYGDLYESGDEHARSSRFRDALVEGNQPSWFLMPPKTDGTQQMGWSLVNFRALHVVSKDFFTREAIADKRVALASPYREHLSQSFARFVMRVGLPATLHSFKKWQPQP